MMEILILVMVEMLLELLKQIGHEHLEIHQQQAFDLISEEMGKSSILQQVIEMILTHLMGMDEIPAEL